jgi:hypothetical protein
MLQLLQPIGSGSSGIDQEEILDDATRWIQGMRWSACLNFSMAEVNDLTPSLLKLLAVCSSAKAPELPVRISAVTKVKRRVFTKQPSLAQEFMLTV